MAKENDSVHGFKLSELISLTEDKTKESQEMHQLQVEHELTNTVVTEPKLTPVTNGNGNSPGLLWEQTIWASTLEASMESVYGVISAELTETRARLRQAEGENQLLAEFHDHWLSNQYKSEALAMSDDNTLLFFTRFLDREALSLSEVAELVNTPEQWLAMIRLTQANLIHLLGSYIYLTARGEQILRVVLNHDQIELEA